MKIIDQAIHTSTFLPSLKQMQSRLYFLEWKIERISEKNQK